MVWFQCEDCGENLKKPKLANHFRRCSAYRLSCIDCGKEFDQQSVQKHTQCVSEVQKYGPKGAAGTPKDGSAEEATFGLSTQAPWSCSLCNVKATSQETILIHGQSKRHKAKARAVMKQQSSTNEGTTENVAVEPKECAKPKEESTPKDQGTVAKEEEYVADADTKEDTVAKTKSKKRKRETQDKPEDEEVEKNDVEIVTKAIKWRKLICRELKKASEGVLRKKQLVKAILPSAKKLAEEAGVEMSSTALKAMLDAYLDASTRFAVEGKRIRLATV